MPSYRMTEAQAEAVVRMQLGQLAALERDEILKEYNDLRGKILGYEQLLSNEQNIREVIKNDLRELRDKYGDDRKTEITGAVGRLDLEDLIAEEDNAVTISHDGYIKRLPLNTYRTQHRGGKGVSGGATREDDFIEHFFVASTHAYLLCFTNRGQLYWIKVYDIPAGSRTSTGRAIANVLSLKPEEKITSMIPVRRFDAGGHLIMATRRGLVKKTALQEYSRPRSGGIIGISLDEGDTLIDVVLTQPGDEVVLCTRNGMAIRFDESNARAMGRNTRGVKGINLQGDDEVVGMVVADPEGYLLTVCENGYGKRTPFGANTAGAEPSRRKKRSEEPRVPRNRRSRGAAERGGRRRAFGHALSQAAPRRQGRPRHPHQRTQRPGRRRRLGARRRRHHAHHDRRHGQPHPRPRDPRRRPQHAGRAHHEPQRRRQDRFDRPGGARGTGGASGGGGCARRDAADDRRVIRSFAGFDSESERGGGQPRSRFFVSPAL